MAENPKVGAEPQPSEGPTAERAATDTLPAAGSAAPGPVPAGAIAARTLAAGTKITAALNYSINSRRDKAGRAVTAQVMDDVTGPTGRTIIPAGTRVRLTVTELEPAKSRDAASGKLAFRVDGIELDGQLRPVNARVEGVPHELRGRGVTAGEVEKVGAGAAAGAVVGRVLGGNTKGAVIGGVVGAAGGAAVAVQTASRDVVVKARTPVVLVLTAPLVGEGP